MHVFCVVFNAGDDPPGLEVWVGVVKSQEAARMLTRVLPICYPKRERPRVVNPKPLKYSRKLFQKLVGERGFEPPAPTSRT